MALRDNLPSLLESVANDELRTKLLAIYKDTLSTAEATPAAVKHHHNWKGGYLDHVCEVTLLAVSLYQTMCELTEFNFGKDDVILVAFIHDLDKLHRYMACHEDWKIKKGQVFDYNPKFPVVDDAAYVVQMVNDYGIRLQPMHIEAVSLHHGGWSNRLASKYAYPGDITPLATILHAADLLSGKCLGKKSM